jgi:hypothetical protein
LGTNINPSQRRSQTIILDTAITKKATLSLAILVGCLFFAVSCGSDAQPPSGDLPTWNVGDTWTMKGSSANVGDDLILVETVTGEQVFNGIDCYTINIQASSPSIGNIFTGTEKIDKTTLDSIEAELSYSINGTEVIFTGNISYDYSAKPYPLSVGKTWAVTVNRSDSGWMGEGHTETTDRYTYKVENVESVTVPAGTFQCFKIVEYNSDNSIGFLYWVTDTTGIIVPVKEIDNLTGLTTELTSYSLSE